MGRVGQAHRRESRSAVCSFGLGWGSCMWRAYSPRHQRLTYSVFEAFPSPTPFNRQFSHFLNPPRKEEKEGGRARACLSRCNADRRSHAYSRRGTKRIRGALYGRSERRRVRRDRGIFQQENICDMSAESARRDWSRAGIGNLFVTISAVS